MAVGQAGKILIRGPQVMLGYQNNAEATAAVIDKEGFFDTGTTVQNQPVSRSGVPEVAPKNARGLFVRRSFTKGVFKESIRCRHHTLPTRISVYFRSGVWS